MTAKRGLAAVILLLVGAILLARLPDRDGMPAGPEGDAGAAPSGAVPERLAAHEFIPVGETRSYGNLGDILEVVDLDGAPVTIDQDAGTLTCVHGGVACLRARYRPDGSENNVQTKCVACVDEVGSCAGAPAYSADLGRFTDRGGDANWLATGAGTFYDICQVGGRLRLETNRRSLPPLYLVIVDALGDGAYSLGSDEYERQRNGTIRTFSGETLQPPWITFLGGTDPTNGTSATSIGEDGTLAIDFADCRRTPECTTDATFLRPGDLVEIGTVPDDGLIASYAATDPGALDAVLRHHGITDLTWDDLQGMLMRLTEGEEMRALIREKVQRRALDRLLRLQVFAASVRHYDAIHGLREKGIPVVFAADTVIDCVVPGAEARARCDAIEDRLEGAEARALAALKREGYRVWIRYQVGDEPTTTRPHLENFDGLLLVLEEGRADPATLTSLLGQLPRLNEDLPLILVTEGPVKLFADPNLQCEASYCPSNLSGSFAENERAIDVVLRRYPQVVGIGVRTFEGAHFDIRDPIEGSDGYELNRIAETGYNNPVLNLYLARE